ncbi:hypothetical protein H3C61_01905 [Candidatus Gracilibacteria bacterium]|nr:hypothetical protein [Candidatus Gracilibacteria bacterium]
MKNNKISNSLDLKNIKASDILDFSINKVDKTTPNNLNKLKFNKFNDPYEKVPVEQIIGNGYYFDTIFRDDDSCVYTLKKDDNILGIYDFIGSIITLNSGDKIFYAKIGNECMYINVKTGKSIGGEFEQIYSIQKGINNDQIFSAKKNDKEMYVSFFKKIPIGGEFDQVWDIYDISNTFKVFLGIKNGKQAYINLDNGNFIGGEFDQVSGLKKYGKTICFLGKNGENKRLINLLTQESIGPYFDELIEINKDKNGKYFYIYKLGINQGKIDLKTGIDITDTKTKIFNILKTKII